MQAELIDKDTQVPPHQSADLSGLLVEQLTDSPLSELHVARTLGWQLSSVTERMVRLGEDAVAWHEL